MSGPGKSGFEQPEGGHRQAEVSDRGVSRRAEESDGEDEGECQEHQELYSELERQCSWRYLPIKDGAVKGGVCFQKETDERVVELQNMVQAVTHTEAEIQQMYSFLQDLESSMNNTKQRQEEVCSLSPAHSSETFLKNF